MMLSHGEQNGCCLENDGTKVDLVEFYLSIYPSIYLSVYLFSLSLFIAPPRLHADTKGELDHLIELE